MSKKEYTPRNILSLIAFGAATVAGIALITGCSESNQGPEVTPVFTPSATEFVLEDGTRCVMFSAPYSHNQRAGESGVSCDWKSKAE